jgi:hypothetical protein
MVNRLQVYDSRKAGPSFSKAFLLDLQDRDIFLLNEFMFRAQMTTGYITGFSVRMFEKCLRNVDPATMPVEIPMGVFPKLPDPGSAWPFEVLRAVKLPWDLLCDSCANDEQAYAWEARLFIEACVKHGKGIQFIQIKNEQT